MSDYSLQATWSTKDALATGQALKAISATELGTEFSAISTAIATKLDSDDFASQAEAEALTSDVKIITPHSLNDVLVANAGALGDIQALTDPGSDQILFWDDSDSAIEFLTIGDGLAITANDLAVVSTIAGAGLTWTSGVAAVGAGNGITVNANDVALTDAAATASNPIDISSGTVDLDITALTNIEGSALAATDELVVDDGGTPKALAIQDIGFRIQTGQTTQTLAANDMNSIMIFTGTATLTLDENATVDIPLGVPVVLVMDHATQTLTVQADTSVTLQSVFHPGGTANASDTVSAGGMAVLVQVETDVWQISGDIAT